MQRPSRLLLVAAVALGALTVATDASAATTSKPATSNSHYVRNLKGTGADVTTAEAEGQYDARQAHPDATLVLLSYGDQTSSPAGATTTGGTGYSPTDAQVVAHAEAYLDGFRSVDPTSHLTLVVGTNNDLGWIARDAPAAGKDWADHVVDPVASYAARYTGTVVEAGMDIEDWGGDGTYAQTKAWITSYLANTTSGFVNHGAASGCPIGYTSGTSAGCNGGWTQAQYFAVSGGLSPSRMSVLPQIYNNDMDDQWESIDLVGITQGGTRLSFAGVLSENRANLEDTGKNTNLTPLQAWNALWARLRSDARTTQSSLDFSTDLFDDAKTQTPPVPDDSGAGSGAVHGCPSGDVCIYPGTDFNGDSPSLRFTTYGAHNLHDQVGRHVVLNNQYGGASAYLCSGYDGTGDDLGGVAGGGASITPDLTPVNSVVLRADGTIPSTC